MIFGDAPMHPHRLAIMAVALGLPASTPEPVVKAQLLLDIGAADDLIAEADAVLSAEVEWLRTCEVTGWDDER